MTRRMYDGITPSSVPIGADAYAGYVGGNWPSYSELVRRYPNALHVSIAVNAAEDARVLDVETGDASPDQAPGWAARQRAAGNPFPVIYMNASTWPAVRAAFAAQGVPEPLYWVAAYVTDPTQVPAIPAGAVALQYYDFGGYDASVIADYWPGLDPEPAVTPASTTILKEDDLSTTSVNGRAGLAWAAGTRHVIEVNYAAAGQVDLELNIELKLTTGPVYVGPVGPWIVSHQTGTSTYEIPAQYIASCRGAILTVHAGPADVVYDVCAV